MEIGRLLVKTKLGQLREELSQLDREIRAYPTPNPESENLKIFVRLKLQGAEMLSVALDHITSTGPDRPNLEDMFRQIKNDARMGWLRWRRFQANQGRLDKKRKRTSAAARKHP